MPHETGQRLEALRLANARRADEVVAALVDRGVRVAFVAPGSRSTPLVLALVRAGVEAHVVLDERGAAFHALGAARTGTLAVVVTTSGTAVANLLPACAEGSRDHVAFVCCTADRPQHDVARGASQTLPQPPLLAGAVRHVLDLPAPDGTDAPPVEPLLTQALDHLFGPDAGPIHLNVRFDKPLEPPEGYVVRRGVSALTCAPSGGPVNPTSSGGAGSHAPKTVSPLPASPGLVIIGALPHAARAAVAAFVAQLGWPVVADVTSGVVPPAELARLPTVALRSAQVRAAVKPRSVLWLGGLTTEDAIPSWLMALRSERVCPVSIVTTTGSHRDPFALADSVSCIAPEQLAAMAAGAGPADAELVAVVRRAAAAVGEVCAALDAEAALSEPAIARAVTASVMPGEALLLGNSMPVRDADRFGALADGVQLIVNRGAAGIDGCTATAMGACLATGRPTTALLGDLAVLHDLSSLAALAAPEWSRKPLRLVVVNNAGGGIFSFLPVGDRIDAATMQRFFETPHTVRLSQVAAALGLRATTVEELATLRQALSEPPAGPELIEVFTDRRDNVAAHRALDARLERAVSRALEACS